METLFVIANFAVVPFWFLMIFLPHWRWSLLEDVTVLLGWLVTLGRRSRLRQVGLN